MFFSRPAGHKYVGREDISDYDFTKAVLIQDSSYHDLDLSSIVPVGTTLVAIHYRVAHSNANEFMKLKKKGALTDYNAFIWVTLMATQEHRGLALVECDKNRKIEYHFSTPDWLIIYLTIYGWFV